MELRVVGSGSSGNAYVLNGKEAALLIECGLPYREQILPALDFERSKLQGCIVSHAHKDHSKYLPNILGDAIHCYMPSDLFAMYDRSRYAHCAEVGKVIKVGDFAVLPFECVHDVECNGYVISHPEMGIVLFATDTGYIPADFSTFCFSHIMIEANYGEEIIHEKMEQDESLVPHFRHVMRGHMSIEGSVEYLHTLDLRKCETVTLIHLSNDNSNEKDFIARAQKEFPLVRVQVAHAKDKFNFNKKPY